MTETKPLSEKELKDAALKVPPFTQNVRNPKEDHKEGIQGIPEPASLPNPDPNASVGLDPAVQILPNPGPNPSQGLEPAPQVDPMAVVRKSTPPEPQKLETPEKIKRNA